jgi:hypothetical protein
MPRPRTIQRSFAGGEMSPSMHARVDDVKFQNGFAAGTRNYLVRSNGVADRRPGTRHVARVKDSSKLTRLIPFVHSIDSTFQVEMGNLYFRWHRFGTPLLYATPRTIASVTTGVGTSSITFEDPHGFTGGEAIQFIHSTGDSGNLPDPLASSSTYTVTVVDTKTITIATNLTDAGIDTSYAYLDSEIPRDYVTSKNVTAVNAGTEEITFGSAHELVVADPINFTVSGGTIITNVVAGTTYYAIIVSPTVIKLAETAAAAIAGTPVFDIGAIGTGTTKMHLVYEVGDLVMWEGTGHGVFYCLTRNPQDNPPPAATTYWYQQPREGVYEIPHPYTEAQLAAVGYDGDNDVLTLTHKDQTPGVAELAYVSDLRWTYTTITFAPDLVAPVAIEVTETYGVYQEFDGDNAADTLFTTEPAARPPAHGLFVGDSVYVEGDGGIGSGDSFGPGPGGVPYPAGFYEVSHTGAPGAGVASIDLKLKTVTGGVALTLVNDHVFMRRADPLTDTIQNYRVTAVTADGLESQSSNTVSAANTLTTPGSSNLVRWTPNAVQPSRYHVYRKLKGVYGFIGKVEGSEIVGGEVTFKDDNLPTDMSHTLPIFDTSMGVIADESPATVTTFDGRRFFAGTNLAPNSVWATRAGTDTDLSYHVPSVADDRLQFRLRAKDAVSIRHLVPLTRLAILTNSTEFQIIPVNSEVLTPSTIESRSTGYEGASVVKPVVMSSNILFAANRGGHVMEMGEGAGGFLTKPGDLCLRAEHLFDGETILDQSAAKAPHPIDWFCSSSGLLLGLTYVPQEQIGAWHAHDTAASGFFESACVTAEGDEDAVYAIVRRTIDGSTVRSVERFAAQFFTELKDAYFVDAGGTFDGTNTDVANTMTVSGGTTWLFGDTVTLTAFKVSFVLGASDVGDHVAVRESATGAWYRVRITAVSTNKIATGVLLQALPVALRNVALSTWAFARGTIKVSHLEGETLQVLADGLVQGEKEVTSEGIITLDTPGIVVQTGLAMPAPLVTLPVGLQVAEAFGQGREKNVNKAILRVKDSGAFRIGPAEDGEYLDADLVPANADATAGTVRTAEVDTTLLPEWQPGGEIVILQDEPLPLTVLGLVLEVSLGGG